MKSKFEFTGIPAPLVEVALIDGTTSSAIGGMSLSWWLAEVAAGRAPAPAVRMSRCTRWRLADVRTFWVKFAGAADDRVEATAFVVARAQKGAAAAQAKRAGSAIGTTKVSAFPVQEMSLGQT